jgi:hypothetical protein
MFETDPPVPECVPERFSDAKHGTKWQPFFEK